MKYLLCAGLLVGIGTAQAQTPVPPEVHAAMETLKAAGVAIPSEGLSRAIMVTLAKTADPQSRWLNNDEKTRLANRLSGLCYDAGVQVMFTNGVPILAAATSNSPAASLKDLDVGLAIERIDGASVTNGLSPVDIRYLLRSTQPDPLELILRVSTNNLQTTTVARVESRLPAIEGVEEWPFGFVYFNFNGIYQGTGPEVKATLLKHRQAGASGFILDLRGAAGGDIDAALEIAGLFPARKEKLVTITDGKGRIISTAKAASTGDKLKMPVMVLVNGYTEGAAEALAIILQQSVHNVLLAGAPTRGDAAVREVITLPDIKDSLYIAIRRLDFGQTGAPDGRQPAQPDILNAKAVPSIDVDYANNYNYFGKPKEPSADELAMKKLLDRSKADVTLRLGIDILLGIRAVGI